MSCKEKLNFYSSKFNLDTFSVSKPFLCKIINQIENLNISDDDIFFLLKTIADLNIEELTNTISEEDILNWLISLLDINPNIRQIVTYIEYLLLKFNSNSFKELKAQRNLIIKLINYFLYKEQKPNDLAIAIILSLFIDNFNFGLWHDLGFIYDKLSKFKEGLLCYIVVSKIGIIKSQFSIVEEAFSLINDDLDLKIEKDPKLPIFLKQRIKDFEQITEKLLAELDSLSINLNHKIRKKFFELLTSLNRWLEIMLTIEGYSQIFAISSRSNFLTLSLKDLNLGLNIEKFRGLSAKLIEDFPIFSFSEKDFQKNFSLKKGEGLLFLYSRPEGTFYELWISTEKFKLYWIKSKLFGFNRILPLQPKQKQKYLGYIPHYKNRKEWKTPYEHIQTLFNTIKFFVETLKDEEGSLLNEVLKSNSPYPILKDLIKETFNTDKITFNEYISKALLLYSKLIDKVLNALNKLFKPLIDEICKKAKEYNLHRIYIVPFGEAINVPLHALKNSNGNYLIQEVEIAYLPPLRFNSHLSIKFQNDFSICAIKGSSHFYPEETLKEFPSVLIDNEEAFQKDLTCKVIHFETHASVDLEDEFQSLLILFDKYVGLKEFYERYLPKGYLGVLLACEVGFGKKLGLDLSFSFPLSFALKGYSEFLLPLLDIPYEPIIDFIRKFYENYRLFRDLPTAFRQTVVTHYLNINEKKEDPFSFPWKIFLPFKKIGGGHNANG